MFSILIVQQIYSSSVNLNITFRPFTMNYILLLQERFPSASAIIDTITFEKTSNTNVTFNVDSFVQNIRIEITGPYDTLEVDLTYSGGMFMFLSSLKISLIFCSQNGKKEKR